MLSPTILSINWFFSFILLRRLEEIQRNSQASCSENTMVQRIFLYFFEKTRGSGFWTIKICFVDTIRIRGRTLRPESLDWYAARDSERVVRTYQEMDVRPVSLSSTTDHPENRMWDIALRNGTLENPLQCEGFEIKGKGRETFCECFGERTPFQQGRVQLQDTSEKGRSKNGFTLWIRFVS